MKINRSTVYSFSVIFILLVNSCGPRSGTKERSRDDIKYNQYLIEGKRLYIKHCSNCHQEDGTGLARLYPPLKDSDYLIKDVNRVICLIKNGQEGEITVNGVTFNQPMPANPRLTNLEIAEISTYIYTMWGDSEKMFTHQEIGNILKECHQEK